MADFGGTAVTFSRAFVINDRAYVGTGYDPTRAFRMYDPAANTWTRKADFGGEARGAAAAFAINARGYFGLGYGNNGQCGDLWEYDPGSDRWTQKASLPGQARDHAGAFSIGQKAYVFGGTAGTDTNAVLLREVWEYDPQADAWTAKPDFSGPARGGAVAFVLEPYIYIGTGTSAANQVLRDFWRTRPGQ
jgi:N-acetylneuraminic acid mutarotase